MQTGDDAGDVTGRQTAREAVRQTAREEGRQHRSRAGDQAGGRQRRHACDVELGPRNDAANGPIKVVAKDLMLMSYEAVRSCGASRDHDISQGIASLMLTR